MKRLNAALREELQRVEAKEGTPRRIYKWALKHKDSHLYAYLKRSGAFDPKRAMEEYGVVVISRLVVRCKIIYAVSDKETLKIREYVSLKSDRQNGGGYRRVEDVLADKDLTLALVRTLRSEMRALARKYEVIKHIASVRGFFEMAEEEDLDLEPELV